MNAILFANSTTAWLVAGWTMVHFLWLGAIVAAAAFIARALLRRTSPNLRYAVALACLAILAALPVATAAWLLEYSPPLNGGAGGGVLASIPTRLPATLDANLPSAHPNQIIELHTPSDASEPVAADQPSSPASVAGSPIANLAPNSPNAVRPSTLDPRLSTLTACIPYLPWLWLIGTPFTFALLVSGLVGTRRLGRASRPVHDGPIADILACLTASLHITRRITVAVCDRIAAPVLIGIVRPMILLPPAALTGWSPDEIEMVLLHELAHVRRWDNLINLLQRCLESLLFFHPAVWLISNWARREREACCDAAVVARTNHPHAYAELLVNIASQIQPSHSARGRESSEPSPPGRGQTSLESSPPGRGQGEGDLPNRRTTWSPPSVASAMAAGPLRSRIRRILQLEDDPMLISGKSFTLMLAGVITAATLAIFYLPTIGHAEQSDTEGTEKQTDAKIAKQKAQTQNNLKKLAIALQNYHDTNSNLPRHAIYDERGNQLLSWRVLILPLLGEETLYKEFHLDEPWNSEHNRAFIAKMPSVFKDPKINKPGMTNYLAVVGKECGFDGTSKGLGFVDITDGTSKTISIVEADPDLAVEWTKPQDWNFDRAHPTKGLGHLWPDCWYAAWFDGSVRRVENSEPADVIGSQFTRAGREINSLKESAARAGKTRSLRKGIDAMGGVGELRREEAMGGPGEMRPSPARGKFPSLEEQKLADLAGDKSHEKSQTPTSSEERVFATLPSQSNNPQDFQEFAKAFAEAEKKNLRLELVTRDGKQLLVATPQPTEKDWPAVLGAPPRKERVIAERAWKRLGLKLVPLSSAEVTYRELIANKPVGLLIVGGNLPNGVPIPSLLTRVDGHPVESMDGMLYWLDSESGRSQKTVRCHATANGKQYLFDAGPLESTTSVQSATSNQRAEPHEVAPERARDNAAPLPHARRPKTRRPRIQAPRARTRTDRRSRPQARQSPRLRRRRKSGGERWPFRCLGRAKLDSTERYPRRPGRVAHHQHEIRRGNSLQQRSGRTQPGQVLRCSAIYRILFSNRAA